MNDTKAIWTVTLEGGSAYDFFSPIHRDAKHVKPERLEEIRDELIRRFSPDDEESGRSTLTVRNTLELGVVLSSCRMFIPTVTVVVDGASGRAVSTITTGSGGFPSWELRVKLDLIDNRILKAARAAIGLLQDATRGVQP